MKIVLIGPQGSGKGTQAKMLSEKYNIPHISTGDMFRAAVRSGSELGNKVKGILDQGKLVPDELTSSIVKERLEQEDCANGYILDGFPRTVPQAIALDTFSSPDIALDIEIPDDTAVERLSSRWQCKTCGAIFGAATPPKEQGVCDKDRGELFQRNDDKPEAIRKRLAEYHEKTKPLIDYYNGKKKLLEVDGSKPVDEVFAEITERLDKN